MFVEVGSGAEGGAGTSQHHGTHRRIGFDLNERGLKPLYKVTRKRVAAFRAVEREAAHPGRRLVDE
jgi:hypothetical protein